MILEEDLLASWAQIGKVVPALLTAELIRETDIPFLK